ncbi:NAD-specific glutamate dehydrogenase [Symbiodinium microadriaticum]|uniref:NAD-specific glutamate dehydrogenase n=1 Tax=Symbiodinium microadriaticum TaxID=2951 RepID=A0A1Q9F155_SYMMI|nr:NAD-specific glutamate dehydrogenase [Symbiodinium microadriaticum]
MAAILYPALVLAGLYGNLYSAKELDDISRVEVARRPLSDFWSGILLGTMLGLWVGINYGETMKSAWDTLEMVWDPCDGFKLRAFPNTSLRDQKPKVMAMSSAALQHAGRTLFPLASRAQTVEKVEQLFQCQVASKLGYTQMSKEGTAYDMRTPLHLAAAAGDLKLAKFLLEVLELWLQGRVISPCTAQEVQNGYNDVRRYLQSWKLTGLEELEEQAESIGTAKRPHISQDGMLQLSPTGAASAIPCREVPESVGHVTECDEKPSEAVFQRPTKKRAHGGKAKKLRQKTVGAKALGSAVSGVSYDKQSRKWRVRKWDPAIKKSVFRGSFALKKEAEAKVSVEKAEKKAVAGPLQQRKKVFALGDQSEPLPEIMSTVFELVVKEGIFSFTTVQAEVEHFFNCLGFHRMSHIRALEFDFSTDHSAFFLTALSPDPAAPTESQRRTERKIAEYIGPRPGLQERGHFEVSHVAENETSLQILASSTFLKGKTREAIEQYQIIMEDVVASRRSMVNIIPGEAYPGNFSGATAGLVLEAMRFVGLVPRRFYFSTFANGVIAYSLFFPAGVPETQVECLKRALLYSTLLKDDMSLNHAQSKPKQSQISHECGLYVLAAAGDLACCDGWPSEVKFVYTFFPKEQYAPEYISVHKDLLSTERIYSLIHRHPNLARLFFEDFALIARGATHRFLRWIGVVEGLNARRDASIFTMDWPGRVTEREVIDEACTDPQDRQILKMFLTFNHSVIYMGGLKVLVRTNFFKAQIPGLDPAVALKDSIQKFPTARQCREWSFICTHQDTQKTDSIYLVCGRDFMGFHTRFRDVARGGIRLVLSRDKTTYDRNFATLFDECYNLAFTQQYKNKAAFGFGDTYRCTGCLPLADSRSQDIPEGGSKGVILPDRSWPNGQSCFTRYLNALLDCMMPEESGIFAGHLRGRRELLFFGPDESLSFPFGAGVLPVVVDGIVRSVQLSMNTAAFMDMGANVAKAAKRKPSMLGRLVLAFENFFKRTGARIPLLEGFDHGVHTYVKELLRELGEDYASADLFVPCGGRPEVTTDNVKKLFTADGSRPKFRLIVEGANLFFSDRARGRTHHRGMRIVLIEGGVLEGAGVHVFKDASTNKANGILGILPSSLKPFGLLGD